MPITFEARGSRTLVIAATGFANKLNLPTPDFFEQSGLSDASRIIISDPTKRCSLGGLEGPPLPSFREVVEYLQELVQNTGHQQLIVTGTSGGAHTALLLGHLLKASQVVTFAPYPYLSIKEFKNMRDPALYSMARVLQKLQYLPASAKEYFDVKSVLKHWNGVSEYHIHVSRYNTWDYRRSMSLSGLPKVNIIAHPYREHGVASLLAKQKKLAGCFRFPYQKERRTLDPLLAATNFCRGFMSRHINKRERMLKPDEVATSPDW